MNDLINKLDGLLSDKSSAKTFAVFDFDHTCITNDIGEATLAYLAKNDLFRDNGLLPDLKKLALPERSEKIFRHYHRLLAKNEVREAYEFNAKILSNWNVSEMPGLAENVLTFLEDKTSPEELFGVSLVRSIEVKSPVIDLMKHLQRKNIPVWIISASPELLVANVLKHFKLQAGLIGIRNVIVKDTITASLEYPTSILEGKVECIKKYIQPADRPLLAVGDSLNDLPMLDYSEIKIVVDRDNELSRLARARKWYLI